MQHDFLTIEAGARRAGAKAAAALPAVILGFSICAMALPAAAADRPDLTGVWGTYRGPDGGGGFRRGPQPDLPLRPEAKQKVDEYRALVAPNEDTPGGFCLGSGMPGSMLGSGGYPMEIVQHDDVILVVYEAHSEIRRIYTDGRVVPEEDLFPDRNGFSMGRWEGDKLIVETTHLKEAVDQSRFPHSAEAKIVEEYTLETMDDGSKVLTAQMTMTDPAWYTQPVTAEKKWTYLPQARLLPYECNEPAWEEHLEKLRQERQQASSTSAGNG